MVCVVSIPVVRCDGCLVVVVVVVVFVCFRSGCVRAGCQIDMSGKGAVCRVRLVAQAGLLKRNATDHLHLLSTELSRQLAGTQLETRSELSFHLECRLERQPDRLSATCAMVRSCVLEESLERGRRRRSSSCNAISTARSLAIEIHP
jgi:hypothetical protein